MSTATRFRIYSWLRGAGFSVHWSWRFAFNTFVRKQVGRRS